MNDFTESSTDEVLSDFIVEHHCEIHDVVKLVFHLYHQPVEEDDVDDLTAEIEYNLIKNSYKNLRSFQHKSSFKTWVKAIAFHDIGNFLRKRKRSPMSLSDISEIPLSKAFTPEQILAENDRLELARQAIASLSKREQLLIRLSVVDELHAKDIAEIMGIKTESVYQRKSTIIKKIQVFIFGKRGGVIILLEKSFPFGDQGFEFCFL